MTDQELLDMFACAAMEGLISSGVPIDDDTFANSAYNAAENMLVERKKRYGDSKCSPNDHAIYAPTNTYGNFKKYCEKCKCEFVVRISQKNTIPN